MELTSSLIEILPVIFSFLVIVVAAAVYASFTK